MNYDMNFQNNKLSLVFIQLFHKVLVYSYILYNSFISLLTS